MSLTVAVIGAVLIGGLVGSCLTVLAWRIPNSAPVSGASATRRRSWWADIPAVQFAHLAGRDSAATAIAVRPPILEFATASLFGLVTVRFGVSWVLSAYLYLAAAAVLLAVIDLQHQRLPNVVVVPSVGVAVILLAVGAIGDSDGAAFVRAILGALILFAVFLLLAFASPAGIGMGDVKLAAVLGAFLGYLGWNALFLGAAGAFVISAVVGGVLLLARRVDRRTLLPFGPSMLAAALAVVLLSG